MGGHLVAEETEPTGTAILTIRDEEWAFLETAQAVVAGLAFDQSRNGLLAVGREGETFLMDPHGENMAIGRLPVRGPTYINDVRYLQGEFCAYGGSNQFIVGDGNSWIHADEGIFREFVVGELYSIYTALDFESGTLIVAGRRGLVAERRDGTWYPLDPPTNISIHDVESLGGSRFILVGGGGLFLVSDGGSIWHDLTDDVAVGKTIWSIKRFGGDIFLGLGQELVIIREVSELKFEVIDRRRMEVNRFCANRYLWCIGGELVERFDGSEWRVFECPANS